MSSIKPLLCYRSPEELHLTVCEISSAYFPEYQMHILPLDELLLICSCIFVVERLDSCSGRAVTHVLQGESLVTHDHEWHAFPIVVIWQRPAARNFQLIRFQFPFYV
jgi:hypothetical protein